MCNEMLYKENVNNDEIMMRYERIIKCCSRDSSHAHGTIPAIICGNAMEDAGMME